MNYLHFSSSLPPLAPKPPTPQISYSKGLCHGVNQLAVPILIQYSPGPTQANPFLKNTNSITADVQLSDPLTACNELRNASKVIMRLLDQIDDEDLRKKVNPKEIANDQSFRTKIFVFLETLNQIFYRCNKIDNSQMAQWIRRGLTSVFFNLWMRHLREAASDPIVSLKLLSVLGWIVKEPYFKVDMPHLKTTIPIESMLDLVSDVLIIDVICRPKSDSNDKRINSIVALNTIQAISSLIEIAQHERLKKDLLDLAIKVLKSTLTNNAERNLKGEHVFISAKNTIIDICRKGLSTEYSLKIEEFEFYASSFVKKHLKVQS